MAQAEGECCLWSDLKARAPTSYSSSSVHFFVRVSHVIFMHACMQNFRLRVVDRQQKWLRPAPVRKIMAFGCKIMALGCKVFALKCL